MKKTKLLLLLLSLCCASVFTSCKKTPAAVAETFKCASCTAAPNALVANNTISKGIYKGVLIGSSGTIKFDVLNGGATISAIMVIDGITVNLTSSISWVAGQAYVAPFTGTLNGAAVSITFQVDQSGAGPVITSATIPGHPSAQFSLIKETSLALVEAFEGTYSTTKPETGTFNILVSRVLGKWGGVSRKLNGTSNGEINGTMDGSGAITSDGTKMGTITGDKLDGTFTDSNAKTVTITGKRTL